MKSGNVPLNDIRINLFLAASVASVKALCLSKDIGYTLKGNSINIVVPVLHDYKVLKIDL